MAPNTHHSLFLVHHYYVLTGKCLISKLSVVYGRSAYWTTSLYTTGGIPCVVYGVAWEIQLENYGPRHASVVLWYNIVMRILPAHAYIAFSWATTNYNKTHVAYDCILHAHQMMASLSTMHHLKKTNLANYFIHIAVSSNYSGLCTCR